MATGRAAVAGAVAGLIALTGCTSQRPTVDAAAPAVTQQPAPSPADTDTCATWTTQQFKGGDIAAQVAGARATWVSVLVTEATGRELGDTEPGDPGHDVAVRIADRLSLYCAGHPSDLLVAAVVPAMRAAGVDPTR
jgi:hypothetical protein